ncbi:MAG: ABC transporter ATP-binding protein [Bdellovibrionales bacterium]
MLNVKGITKYYGDFLALDDLSFELDRSQVVGLIGPNGAGKSTAMNILSGAISASQGSIDFNGKQIRQSTSEWKSNVGFLPEQVPIYSDMTVSEFLSFSADLKKILPEDKDNYIRDASVRLGLVDVLDNYCGNLSKGFKQRLGLATAILAKPTWIILDEPLSGLDPEQVIQIRSLIQDLKSDHSILISSHNLSELESLCDRAIILVKGKKRADQSIRELLGKEQSLMSFRLEFRDNPSLLMALECLEELKLNFSQVNKFSTDICFDSELEMDRCLLKLLSQGVGLVGVNRNRVKLEDVFISALKDNEDALL